MGKKRIGALLICAVMLIAILPTASFAANATSVFIGTAELNSTTPYYVNGAGGAQGTATNVASGYNAYYDANRGMLTLDGLHFINSAVHTAIDSSPGSSEMVYAISANGDINLVLNTDPSTVSTADTNEHHNFCISVDGALTVSGAGSLTATAGKATKAGKMSVGIYVRASSGAVLTVTSGSLVGNSSDATDNSYGIAVFHGITVSGTGSVTGTSENFHASFSRGVYTDSGITVSEHGSVTGTGGRVSGTTCHTAGIYASSVTVSDSGSVTGTAGKVEGYGNGYGINARNSITFNGGVLIGKTLIPDQLTINQSLRQVPTVNATPYYWRTASNGTYTTGNFPADGHRAAYAELTTTAPLPTTVAFNRLTADGSDTVSTAVLTLTFDKDVAGLGIGDISVNDATKGALTKTGTGVYTLTVSNITVADGGTVRVSVSKDGFAFTPTDKDVTVRKVAPVDPPDIPDAGDRSMPALWLGLLLLAGTGLASSLIIRRKRQNG